MNEIVAINQRIAHSNIVSSRIETLNSKLGSFYCWVYNVKIILKTFKVEEETSSALNELEIPQLKEEELATNEEEKGKKKVRKLTKLSQKYQGLDDYQAVEVLLKEGETKMKIL